MSFNKTLESVKEAGQDYEWYPSTKEILSVLNKDLQEYKKRIYFLDVGAGNGNVFKILEELNPAKQDQYGNKVNTLLLNKFAIEKSQVLINSLDSDIFVVGTDFHQQSFIDKKMDVIFCNPPYSEFKEWTIKLIKESNCEFLYLVIPERWETDEIKKYIDLRKANYEILGEFSFLDSEYRKARANVNLVKICYKKSIRHCYTQPSDPFDKR